VIILFRKRLLLLGGLFIFFCVCSVSFLGNKFLNATAVPAFLPQTGAAAVVIIDPGHGGEDGGAVSESGIVESGLNLEISLRLNDLMRFVGMQTLMTRSEDISVCDDGLDTIRARKASDIRNRVKLVNETDGAVLLSIHQNSLPSSPETHGAQVFWNRMDGAEPLANIIQDALNTVINTERAKQSKKIPDTVYLMKHVTAPAILVECGFLSNAEETTALQEASHQITLVTAIAAGYLRALAGEEVP